MKLRTSIAAIFFIMSLNIYAQTNIFSIETYYSASHEITIEIRNLTDNKITVLIDRGSYINFYKESKQYKSKQLANHPLKATDSLNVLGNIPPQGMYVTKYQVKDTNLEKLYITMKYTLNFISPPANSKWQTYSQEMDILPYDKRRKTAGISERERLSGEYVYATPDVMPQFPGGEKELKHFLEKHTYNYSYNFPGNIGYVRIRVVIEKDGTISHPYLIVGNNSYYQQAALEIIKRMPKWEPGLCKGKAVRTFYTIPILFRAIDRIE